MTLDESDEENYNKKKIHKKKWNNNRNQSRHSSRKNSSHKKYSLNRNNEYKHKNHYNSTKKYSNNNVIRGNYPSNRNHTYSNNRNHNYPSNRNHNYSNNRNHNYSNNRNHNYSNNRNHRNHNYSNNSSHNYSNNKKNYYKKYSNNVTRKNHKKDKYKSINLDSKVDNNNQKNVVIEVSKTIPIQNFPFKELLDNAFQKQIEINKKSEDDEVESVIIDSDDEVEEFDFEIKSIKDLIKLGKKYDKSDKKLYAIDLKKLNNLIEPLEKLDNAIGMEKIKKTIRLNYIHITKI